MWICGAGGLEIGMGLPRCGKWNSSARGLAAMFDRAGYRLFVKINAEVEQTEVAAAIMQVNRSIDLIPIWHDVHAVAFFVSDQCIEGDVVGLFFRSENVATRVGGTCFEGEACGCPDGGEASFKGNAVVFLFLTAAAFAGESKSNDCNQQGTDERSAHQFSPLYVCWCKHSDTNVVKKFGYFLTAYHKF